MKNQHVRVTSLSFSDVQESKVWEAVCAAGRMKSDLIILPEFWAGEKSLDTFNSPRVEQLRAFAKEYSTYIISGIYRELEVGGKINSAIMIGRDGDIVGTYDKNYPYWSEFDSTPPVKVGKEPKVFETDFGKVGVAVCFDVNFPGVWQKMADLGAQMVVWPSAYSAGTSLQAHALNHNYYIVSSTLERDCVMYDITGKEILYNKSINDDCVLLSSVVLDFDRSIFHRNFNEEKAKKLLADFPADVIQEMALVREQWFVLKSVNKSVSVSELARQYGLEGLSAYKIRSRLEIDEMRA